MNEHIEGVVEGEVISFSERDKEELQKLGVTTEDLPTFHPVLQVWQEVLKPATTERLREVSPQWASRITSSYRELNFKDMVAYRESYFDKLEQLAGILAEEIAEDDECLKYDTPEDDRKNNSHHYKNLLLQWQCAILQWEVDWRTDSDDAAVELAAISEVHKMFFGSDGLVAYLEHIAFEYTESDQQLLAEAILEIRGEG